jgi:hypothetical protein
MQLRRKEQSLISTVCNLERVIILTLVESMKGPEAKLLYSQVLDELAKGLPGGKDKVKGTVLSSPRNLL